MLSWRVGSLVRVSSCPSQMEQPSQTPFSHPSLTSRTTNRLVKGCRAFSVGIHRRLVDQGLLEVRQRTAQIRSAARNGKTAAQIAETCGAPLKMVEQMLAPVADARVSDPGHLLNHVSVAAGLPAPDIQVYLGGVSDRCGANLRAGRVLRAHRDTGSPVARVYACVHDGSRDAASTTRTLPQQPPRVAILRP